MIATLYEKEPVLRAITQVGAEKLVLVVDEVMNPEQERNLESIKDTFEKIMKVRALHVPVLDIVEIAERVVGIIDEQNASDHIYLDITASMKPVAIGVLYASFARSKRVSRIVYNSDETHGLSAINLPRMSFRLTDSQRKLLDILAERGDEMQSMSLVEIAEEIGISRAMLYRNIEELKSLDLIDTEDGLALTDAGRIARL